MYWSARSTESGFYSKKINIPFGPFDGNRRLLISYYTELPMEEENVKNICTYI